MDIKIEKKKGIQKKHIPFIAGGIFLLGLIGWFIFGNHASKLNIEKNKVTIQESAKGMFNDYVRIPGQVQPINTIFLSAIEGGMVAEKLIEEGSEVRKGDIIIRLTNPMLSLNILDSEAQLAEKQNFLRNTQVSMEQERLSLKKEKLQLDVDVERKKRKYEQYKQLHSEKLTSKEEYLQAKEDYEFAVDGRVLVVERQKQDSLYRGIQVDQMEESLHNIRKNLVLVRQRVDNLNVKAPVDGQLGVLDVEIGQTVASGERIGQISVLSDYKVEAMIDEHYIDRVKAGLDATFERQNKDFALRVRKVYPEVRDKQFKTDFVFEGERPDNIRAGQTYYINLQLGQPAEAILIPRGPFYQTTGGQWIFVVVPDDSKAVRRKITIGRQNPNYYEVTSGLEPGEKVITSAYDSYGDIQELILK
ncbi:MULTISPECIES: HlyD family efflux transporter periplasmic adaptor subunit [unclassified Dysgonomonas]|jgi:HlyD family secretion protein|uniref:efflux RND transporter periplasmic adaptor subunit n=1 Tax=unclassified Dysgonomonas TaxID=2630389 RepID=UPI0025B9B97B|nr:MULTISPECIES: HlyD family efflux transporter periplasmic adaptor subunit [unclassified Dysgonomonas]MDR2003003.1 HlyD family efflux transporter periplasmic adaptor subunit [Prevotella sp.]HMM03879.1 HlyD family efflux transporter periplasmic adaptor subunit [Dysgonomonas sp.]